MTRSLVTILFVFLVLCGLVGAVKFKEYVNSRIHDEAVAQAINVAAGDRWNQNHTACALRAFVAPSLQNSQKILDSKKTTKAAKARAQNYITKTRRALAIWGTIPPDFDCSTLPKNPPRAPSGL